MKGDGRGRAVQETASGAKADRPVPAHMLASVRDEDTLVIWPFDRLRHLLPHLISIGADLAVAEREPGPRWLTERIDTTPPGANIGFYLSSALAELKRDPIPGQTDAGPAAVSARGRTGGQRNRPTDCKRVALARATLTNLER